jgi:hypothetical protein
MTVLQDLKYIPVREGMRRRKITTKRLYLTKDTIDSFAKTYDLKPWQKELVSYVDIQELNMSHIGRCLNRTRQYVAQEYCRIYDKVIKLGYKVPVNPDDEIF